MSAPQSQVVVVGAALHRLWYIPGDTVRATVLIECVTCDDAADCAPPMFNHYDPEAADVGADDAADHVAVVRQLSAQMVGCCVLHDRQRLTLSGASATCGTSAAAQERRRLCASPVWELLEETKLRREQCVALALTFRLPTTLPSSHAGGVVSFSYALELSASWQPWRASGVAQHAHCAVPLCVLDATGVVLPRLLAHTLGPWPACDDSASTLNGAAVLLGEDDYDMELRVMPVVPSAAIAAPLQSELNSREVGLRTRHTVRQGALAARTNELALRCTPQCVTLPVRGVDVVRVALQSSTVALGGTLRGSLTPLRASGDVSPANAVVVVKVEATLEQIECAPPERVPAGARAVSLPDVSHLLALHTRVVESQTWVPLDSPCTLFRFFFPMCGAVSPTILSDIVTVLWQLRLRFCLSTPAAVDATRMAGCADLVVGAGEPEVVLPLTVVPPRVSERPRCGPVHDSL